jgi:hypothetical protein
MNDNNEMMIPEEVIMSKIYLIRGRKVMLDMDLSELYGVETKQLKRAVRRNEKRFPPDFMFELSQNEFENLRSQFGTSNREMLLTHRDILEKLSQIEQKLTDHDDKILLIFKYLEQLEQAKQQELEQSRRKRIGFTRDNS